MVERWLTVVLSVVLSALVTWFLGPRQFIRQEKARRKLSGKVGNGRDGDSGAHRPVAARAIGRQRQLRHGASDPLGRSRWLKKSSSTRSLPQTNFRQIAFGYAATSPRSRHTHHYRSMCGTSQVAFTR